MPAKRELTMRQIRQMLRLARDGVSAREIGRTLGVALGPLTNLALLLKLHPQAAELVREVVIMGGNALCPGNATPAAEANMHQDPEAADLVLGAQWPVTMIGLDVTHRAILSGEDLHHIASGKTETSRLLGKALSPYAAFFAKANGIDGIFIHDPSTVVLLVRPELFDCQRWPIRVETLGVSRGKTWPALGDTDDPAPKAWQGRPQVKVAVDVNAKAMRSLLVQSFK